MSEFRFEDFEIRPPAQRGLLPGGQQACDVGSVLCDISDHLIERQLYAFADQLRRAALSISNNIAGSAP